MALSKEEKARLKKIKYNMQRNKEKALMVSLCFQRETDMDVVEKIKSQPNKVGYIRDLVRADIAKSNKS